MLRVALTGGMGSGKTAAAAIFRELGCFVSQSDEVARRMMQPGETVYAEIVRCFGTEVTRADGSLDRGALARISFSEGRLEELNAIVHPAVIAAQAAWMHEVGERHPRGVAMVESALVFETRHGGAAGEENAPWRSRFDRVVLLTASEQMRVERTLARAHASEGEGRRLAEDDVRARMRAQLPDEEKAALSDFAIRNEGSFDELRGGVEQVWIQLRNEAEHRADAAM